MKRFSGCALVYLRFSDTEAQDAEEAVYNAIEEGNCEFDGVTVTGIFSEEEVEED